MQIISPSNVQVHAIQNKDGSFYFSGCFESVLVKNGIICADASPFGPGIVTRGFDEPESLDLARPYIFEGPFSAPLISHEQIDVELLESEELTLVDVASKTGTKLCYQTISVRRIPPLGCKQVEPIELYEPEDGRWQPRSFQFHAFRSYKEGRPILRAKLPNGQIAVVGIQRDRRIYLGVPILGIIVQHLHCPPLFDKSYYRVEKYCWPYVLEPWLFEQVRNLAAHTGWPYVRVWPWPAGYKGAFCVRHDFDRPADKGSLESLLAFYERHGIKSTWFWRVGQGNRDLISLVKNSGHELALHTERDGREAFFKEVQFFDQEFDLDMKGYSAHGGRGSCGSLGQRQIEWALESGLEYGEDLVSDSGLPSPGIVVANDTPRLTNLWVPGVHFSLDQGTAPDAYDLVKLRNYCNRRLERGEQIVIMNHPDIHLEELKRFICETDLDGLWKATLLESVRWCRQRSDLRAEYVNGRDVLLRRPKSLGYDVEVWLEGAGRPNETENRLRLPRDFESIVLTPRHEDARVCPTNTESPSCEGFH